MSAPQNQNAPQEDTPDNLVIIGYICVFEHIGKKTWSYHRDYTACQQACVKHHGTLHPVWAPNESGVSLAQLSAST